MRQRGTAAELGVRALLTELGAHYRLNARSLPGSPDIVNRRAGKAIFVHGCFWHRHPGCPRTTTPTRNHAFWAAKFAANQRRDTRKQKELASLGFDVLVVWECELSHPTKLKARLRRFWSR